MKTLAILLLCLVSMTLQQDIYLEIPLSSPENDFPYVDNKRPSTRQGSKIDVDEDTDLFSWGQLKAQSRFLIGFNPFNLFGWYGNQLNPSPMPTMFPQAFTSWVTTSANATTPTLQYCISVSNFMSASSAYMTGPCARRRREASLYDQFLESIQPSKPTQADKSAVREMPLERSHEPLLDSSKEDQTRESSDPMDRQLNNFNFFGGGTTVTSTFTFYSFIATTVKKAISLGTGLLCLPSGMVVC